MCRSACGRRKKLPILMMIQLVNGGTGALRNEIRNSELFSRRF